MASNTSGAVTPNSPQDKVFADAKLFEILASTTICDLGFARQVCKAWKAAIEQTPLLQQKQFLLPFEEPMIKPDFDKMYIERGCIFTAMVRETEESTVPMSILQNPFIKPYTNNLRKRAVDGHIHMSATGGGASDLGEMGSWNGGGSHCEEERRQWRQNQGCGYRGGALVRRREEVSGGDPSHDGACCSGLV